nr:pescadillo homolog isoform X3 [Cherax quadricarinatus]
MDEYKKKKSKRHSCEFSDSEQQYSTKVENVEGRLKKKKKKHKDNQVDEEKNDNKDCNSYAAKNELKCVEEVSQLYHNEPVSDCIESNNTFNEKKRKKHKRKKSIHCDTQEHNGDIDVETGLCKSRSKKRKLDHYLSPDSKLCESVNETAGNVMKDCNCSSEQSKKKKEAGYSGKERYLNEFVGDSIYKKKNRKNKHIPFPVTTCEGNSNLNKTNELKDGHHLTFSEIDKEDLTVFDEYSTKNRSKFFNKNNLSNRDTNSDTSNVPCAVKDQEKSSSHCDRNDMWLSEHYDLMSVDSFDYTDDDYAVPYCSKRRKAEVKKNEKLFENKHNLPLEDELGESEESDSTDNVIAPLYDASYDNVEGNPNSSLKKKRLPGFKSDSCYPTLEKMLYKLPEGEGIPSEEIEEVPEKYQHWKKFREKLNDNAFTEEEIEQEIMDTIKHIHDYFARLEAGSLTEKELEEVKPKNFHGPYFPTPRHIRFFENLNIKINWPLNDLHEFFVTNNYYGKTARMLKDTDIEYITLHSSYAEDMQILKNWKKFQKEYGFYDIRPLTTVRTTRILIDIKGNITFRRFQYVNTENRKRLGLYLVQGLPKRTPLFVFGENTCFPPPEADTETCISV